MSRSQGGGLNIGYQSSITE